MQDEIYQKYVSRTEHVLTVVKKPVKGSNCPACVASIYLTDVSAAATKAAFRGLKLSSAVQM